MKNLLFLCLGSNYDPVLEEKFGFIQNSLEQGVNVKVLSIDIQPLPEEKAPTSKHLTIERIQQRIQSKMISEFVAKHVKKGKEIDQVVICDGIHFMQSELGVALQNELNKVYQHKIPISLFRYISPKYIDPHFNGVPLRQNNHFDFSKFVTNRKDILLPLFKDAKQGERVLNQLSKSLSISNQASYGVLVKFIENVGDKLFKPDGA